MTTFTTPTTTYRMTTACPTCNPHIATTVEELQAWIDERCGFDTQLWLRWMAEAKDGHTRHAQLPIEETP